MPAPGKEDYGSVVYIHPITREPCVVLYEDSEYDEAFDDDCAAICAIGDRQLRVDLCDLRRVPNFVAEFFSATYPSTRSGWIYAVATVPEIHLGRLKVGWTSKPMTQRLRSYRTANPTALLLGLWDADATEEQRVFKTLPGRIGKSEVFQGHDPWHMLSLLREALRR